MDVAGLPMGFDTSVARLRATPVGAPRPTVEGANAEPLQEAGRKLESFFLQMLIRQMRKASGVEEVPYFNGGKGEEIFREQLDERYADALSRRSDIGIARAVYDGYRNAAGREGVR